MSNLSIENLSGMIQGGDIEGMMGKAGGVAPELPALRAMRDNGLETPTTDVQEASKTFSGIMKDSMAKVNEYQIQGDQAVKELVAGRSKNIHETMLTIERADTSLKLMMQVRNKILDAYREIMRMQV